MGVPGQGWAHAQYVLTPESKRRGVVRHSDTDSRVPTFQNLAGVAGFAHRKNKEHLSVDLLACELLLGWVEDGTSAIPVSLPSQLSLETTADDRLHHRTRHSTAQRPRPFERRYPASANQASSHPRRQQDPVRPFYIFSLAPPYLVHLPVLLIVHSPIYMKRARWIQQDLFQRHYVRSDAEMAAAAVRVNSGGESYPVADPAINKAAPVESEKWVSSGTKTLLEACLCMVALSLVHKLTTW